MHLPLFGVLWLVGLTPALAAGPSLGEAIKAADAKYLAGPESGSIDDSAKIVAGGGEEGLPPVDEELVQGPLRLTLTYEEDEPKAATRSLADDLPGTANDIIPSAGDEPAGNEQIPLEDIPEEAMLPGEFDLGDTIARVPVVTVYFDDPKGTYRTAQSAEADIGVSDTDSPDGQSDRATANAPEAETVARQVPAGPYVVAILRGPSIGVSDPPVSIQIAELDPGNAYPEVVVSFFTGGAHCCSVTYVVTGNADGSEWTTVDVGEFDGGPLLAVDLDGNGAYEFETRDNAFLYAFACYACSQAPLQVLALRDGKITNVSAQPRFKAAHAAWLKDMIVGVPEQEVNGFLAGYVGQKIRLGEGKQAWDLMLQHYDRNTDWGLEVCGTERDEGGECPSETTKLTFPEALERMLNKNGYRIGG